MSPVQFGAQIVDQEHASLPGAVLQKLSLGKYQGNRDQFALPAGYRDTGIPIGNLQQQVGAMRTRSGGPQFYIVIQGISQDFSEFFLAPAAFVGQFDGNARFQAGKCPLKMWNQVGDVFAAIVVNRFRFPADRVRP